MKLIFLTVLLSPSFLDKSSGGSNYDNYDPDYDMYDPDYDGYDEGAKIPTMEVAKREASFDLVMTNNSAATQGIELFNYINSFTKKRRTDLDGVTAPYLYIPANSIEGMALQSAGGDGTVGFNQNGDLVIHGTVAAPVAPADTTLAASVSVHCNQTPYQGLFESSNNVPFRITRIRATFLTDAQIDKEIVYFRKSFLGGSSRNSINPRTYFRPEQYQSKIVDIPANLNIDGESGIEYSLLAAEVVKWNVQIEQYRKVTV